MKIIEKAKKIMQKSVCDHCLGRQFAQLLTGLSNRARGRMIRNVMAMLHETENMDINKSNLYGTNLRHEKYKKEKCSVCNDFFLDLEKWAKKIIREMNKIEFFTFLVGTKLNNDLLKKEEQLWEKVGIDYCEPIKAEINREVGKIIEHSTNKTVDLENPDVNFIINIPKNNIDVEINPVFIYGEYQKLKRGIPQTKWPSGKYKTSVEEIIAKPFMKASKAKGHTLHGQGREDINARCLGWRPFILELKGPKKRSLKLYNLRNNINKRKVKIKNLKFSSKNKVVEIKEKQPDKTYKVIVHSKKRITRYKLRKLKKQLKNKTIKQKTPTRVKHRRADKLRKRKIINIRTKYINSQKFAITVKSEAGLYVKELITGDNRRTKPSVSSILDCDCECKQLDVIRIHQ